MPEPVIGARYQTANGPARVLAITPYQARVQHDDGSDPTWTLRGNLGDCIEDEHEHVPSVRELLASCAALLEMAMARMDDEDE